MFGWPVLLAWGIALVFSAVVLVFCIYEIGWKMERLTRDQARLQQVAGDLAAVGQDLAAAQERIAAARAIAGR